MYIARSILVAVCLILIRFQSVTFRCEQTNKGGKLSLGVLTKIAVTHTPPPHTHTHHHHHHTHKRKLQYYLLHVPPITTYLLFILTDCQAF